MLIGLCGGTCAGKQSVTDYLVERHAFSTLHLVQVSNNPSPGDRKELLTSKVCNLELDRGKGRSFSTVDSLLDFVTTRWHERWVVNGIWDDSALDLLSRRPFFLLVSVDAPVMLRWGRFKERCKSQNQQPPSLEAFVTQDDNYLYNPDTGLAKLTERAEVRLVNSSSTLQNLHEALDNLDLLDEQRLRPSWDQYFMQLASLAAQRSNCMKRRVGCVLVREKRVISTGYNGTPRNLKNCNQGGCSRCNGGHGSGGALSTCLCLHAEENALLEAGRERIREGSTLYCDTCPCLTCSVKITQVGVSEVVYSRSYSMDGDTAAIFKEAGVKLRQFSPPRKGLFHLQQAMR